MASDRVVPCRRHDRYKRDVTMPSGEDYEPFGELYIEDQEDKIERILEDMWEEVEGLPFDEKCRFISTVSAWESAKNACHQARVCNVMIARLEQLLLRDYAEQLDPRRKKGAQP